MKKTLIIVESPTKIKTIKKFLGSRYVLASSVGHVRDLPEKELGIDLDNHFELLYAVMPKKQEVIRELCQAAAKCDEVLLAPDPDREGEAIAWHLQQLLPPGTPIKRVTFNAITKDAVLKALQEPREINLAMVDAWKARRALDRLAGYKISPLLNKRIQRGRENYLSAGRVQSVALKLVDDREKEIAAFRPVEYWNVGALFRTHDEEKSFRAALYSIEGKRIEKEPVEGKEVALIRNRQEADAVLEQLKKGPYRVVKVERKEKRRSPVPPFITSTLQQEASRHFRFSASRTMSIAQSLYEGVDLGADGPEGLITYMRTDSVRMAGEAVEEARRWIAETYGKEYLPDEPRVYATQKKAQDAHEAIRPTSLEHTPEKLRAYLTPDQFSLYQLIWRRFLASQMNPAIYDTVSADIAAGDTILLRATGSILKFRGFLALYEEKIDEEEGEEEKRLPLLEEGQFLLLQELLSEQAFTRPPPRYTEASLVKELEKSGIGRPSTYASIMNKIQSREYTVKEGGRLKPTELGQIIAQMLTTSFPEIMNVGFTAQMEDRLEQVAEGERDWRDLLGEFWQTFLPRLEVAEKEAFVPKVATEIPCPKCQEGKLQKIWFKTKYFFGCSRYPDCDYSAPVEELTFSKEDYAPDFNWEQSCPLCQGEMKVRHGRYGAFLGCLRYPECKGIVNLPKKGEVSAEAGTDTACPAVGCSGQMMRRRSRFGKTFYSCSNFPDCDVIVNALSQLEEKYVDHPKTPYTKSSPSRTRAKTTKTTRTASKKTAVSSRASVKKRKPKESG